ncbi:hypothetical protein AKJ52_03005 [candidate division MSBL1 archaeon SCGC-AAA382C18]|uniref:Uncharacterized protein n=1 Tax=candidate division MSBL1 archaeon SCGC-AAA382C18 TaxID=1698281 RepID=A0A133VH92_9EURY|nr:hypothetical protein AKJ52_03005 [candidate division MSBL1 archaeon SCGC-AAA382C18]
MNNLKRFQNLFSALSVKKDLKNLIAEVYKENSDYLSSLNGLFRELQQSNCSGMEEKIEETDANIFQFNSLLRELRFARYLIRNGKFLRFLPQDFMDGKRSPDMMVKDKKRLI